MKKTSVIAINLRHLRIPLIICIFVAIVFLSIILSQTIPAITLSRDTLRWILSSNAAFNPELLPVAATFSLTEDAVPLSADSAPADKAEEKPSSLTEQISVPTATNPNPFVEITDSTDSGISSSDYISPAPSFLKNDFSVLIVHTHTTESYTPSKKYSYTPSDTDRTTDKGFNMVRIGDEIEKVLTAKGIKVYHDTTMNDYPSYSGSYNRSAKIIENYIKKDSSVKIVLDVHRDAIEGKNGEKVKHTTQIDGKTAAKIMLVAGSNISGLTHDNWEENLRFAVQLQRHTQSLYPTLCRPINFRSQRFNQQLAPGGIIVEVGTNGNTLEEALLGAQCFAVSLADFIASQ